MMRGQPRRLLDNSLQSGGVRCHIQIEEGYEPHTRALKGLFDEMCYAFPRRGRFSTQDKQLHGALTETDFQALVQRVGMPCKAKIKQYINC